MKEVKVEWCENFIKAQFGKHHYFAGSEDAGIECNLFWKNAEKSGLWERGTYGTPMSDALEKLTTVNMKMDESGRRAVYSYFKLKDGVMERGKGMKIFVYNHGWVMGLVRDGDTVTGLKFCSTRAGAKPFAGDWPEDREAEAALRYAENVMQCHVDKCFDIKI